MPERIVVCFRGVPALERPDSTDAVTARPARAGAPADPTPPPLGAEIDVDRGDAAAGEERYLARALALKKRAEALGATLCAWSAQTFSFEFATDDIEEAVLLAALAAEDTAVHPDARFAVGIALGEMTNIGEAGRLSMLSWGQPLLVAVMLARIAPPGEVLLDPALPAARSGELMTCGTYRGVDGDRRVRGLRLDVQQPLRRQVVESVARLCKPPLVGRDAEVESLAIPPGTLAIVRAEPGAGGSQLLLELSQHLSPSRTLFIAPISASREPLGALRRALARARARAEAGAPNEPQRLALLPERVQPTLTQLLDGQGAPPGATAELLQAWLAPSQGRFGLVLIDEASEVDHATLEAIAAAVSLRENIRVVVRLRRAEPLPAPLTSLTTAATTTLGPLAAHDAQELVRSFFDGCMSEASARRWATRAQGWPLAVRETLCEALESGALRWIGGVVEPRRRRAGRGEAARTMTAAELAAPPAWQPIEARLRHLATGPRTVLTALAMLGGDAPDDDIDALCAGTGSPTVASLVGALVGAGWVHRPEPGWLKLSSHTLRAVLLAAIPEDEAPAWHYAAARVVAGQGLQLSLADAAWHAAKAGDRRVAAELAASAARLAGVAQLEAPSAELLAFADEQEAADEDLVAAGSDSDSIPPPTYRMAVEVVGEANERPHPPDAAASLGYPDRDASAGYDSPRAVTQEPDPEAAADDTDAPPGTRWTTGSGEFPDLPQIGDEFPFRSEPGTDPLAKTSESPVLALGDVADRLAELAKQALLQGDVRTLERLVGELRRLGGYADLVERMTGFIALSRGATAEALRRLRAAAEADQPPSQRARAHLAYGVALAAAGRAEAALLEVLSGLARAREAQDRLGEQACARFLSRLASATGHEVAARTWTEVARRVGEANAD